jgi:hypothetical protein
MQKMANVNVANGKTPYAKPIERRNGSGASNIMEAKPAGEI